MKRYKINTDIADKTCSKCGKEAKFHDSLVLNTDFKTLIKEYPYLGKPDNGVVNIKAADYIHHCRKRVCDCGYVEVVRIQ